MLTQGDFCPVLNCYTVLPHVARTALPFRAEVASNGRLAAPKSAHVLCVATLSNCWKSLEPKGTAAAVKAAASAGGVMTTGW